MSGGRFFSATSKLYPYGKYSHDGGNVGETQYQDQQPGNIPDWSQKYVYYIGQEIYDPITGAYYRCVVNHVASDVFANDLALLYWVIFSGAAATVTGMRNGLSLVGTFGELGGTLIHGTNIDIAGFALTIRNGATGIANFLSRTLQDSTGLGSINWSTRLLIDSATVSALDYQNRILSDTIGLPSINWNNREGFDTIGGVSYNWNARRLINSSTVETLNWESQTITGTWKYLDGNENLGYIAVSDAAGNITWTSPGAAIGGTAWLLNGNTNGALKYIGTNDAFDFPIYTNGIEAGRILESNQYWGIGTITPSAKLHIKGIDDLNGTNNLLLQNIDNSRSFAFTNDGATLINGRLAITWDNDVSFGALTIQSQDASPLLWAEAGGSGSIGIGFTTPSARLHVRGVDTTAINYALKISDSVGNPIIYTQNNRWTGINQASQVGIEKFYVNGYSVLSGRTDQNGDLYFNGSGFSYITSPSFNFIGTFAGGFQFKTLAANLLLSGIDGNGGNTLEFLNTDWRFKDSGIIDTTKIIEFPTFDKFSIGTTAVLGTSKINLIGSITISDFSTIGNYTLLDTDNVLYVGATGLTIDLPDATLCKGRIYSIKLKTNSVSSCTIQNAFAQTIDLALTYTIVNNGGGMLNGITVQSDGANWNIIY